MKTRHSIEGVCWVALFWVLVVHSVNAFYDPSLGRWLNRDPLGDAGHPSYYAAPDRNLIREPTNPPETWQGPNLYQFVKNDTLNSTDPDGRLCLGMGVCRLTSPFRGATCTFTCRDICLIPPCVRAPFVVTITSIFGFCPLFAVYPQL